MKIKYLFSALAFCGLISQPAIAQSLSADDMGFAFGSEVKSELNAVDPKTSGVALMTEKEMIETKGERAGWVVHGFFDRHGNYRRYTPPPPPPPPVVDRSRPNRSSWVTHFSFTAPSSPHW